MMGIDYQENYHKAREVVADELIEKYGFVESYRDDYRLTLDSTNYSFHLIFRAPEGKGLYVTDKGGLPNSQQSFLAYVFKITNNDLSLTKKLLAEVFTSLRNLDEKDMYTFTSLSKSFNIELAFLSKEYSHFYN